MIFPTLKGKPLGYVNYNLLAIEWFKKNPQQPGLHNPFTDPAAQQELVEEYQRRVGIAYSYGGWLEDRSTIWKGTYLSRTSAFIHLGIDVNAPAGTPIASDNEAEIVYIADDHPEAGGWGPHIIVKLKNDPNFLIYGHLDPEIDRKVGESLKVGEVFAKVGPSSHNGSWLPHVHVQSLTPEVYDMSKKNLDSIDGYAKEAEMEQAARLFPDPMRFIRFE